jgi:hypothetical protein
MSRISRLGQVKLKILEKLFDSTERANTCLHNVTPAADTQNVLAGNAAQHWYFV